MFTFYLVCARIHASFYQINSKQSSVRNVAIEAARTVVERQYKIEDSAGQKANAEEIRAIVKKQLDDHPWAWTMGTAHADREVSTTFTLFIHPKLCPQSFEGHFLHPCIPAIIAKICYTKSGLCVGVSPTFSFLFNPTPLPLIAFAATMVCFYTPSYMGSLIHPVGPRSAGFMEDRYSANYTVFCCSVSRDIQWLRQGAATPDGSK